MGTPEFACAPLASLIASDHDVAAVVTRPDERAPRGGRMRPTPVKKLALQHELTVLTPAKLKSNRLREELTDLRPDLFVVVAFKILPRSLFTLPRLGSINIHASLLPKYRGAAPIHWALINGETETGLSSFVLNEKVDTGDLVAQQRVPVSREDTYDSLYARLSELAGPFTVQSVDRLGDKNFEPLPQAHHQATPAPKITPADAMIDWGLPAEHVYNFVRGLCSVPGAYTFFRGRKVKILACEPVSDVEVGRDTPPGTILPHRKRLIVQCAASAVELTRVVAEGKKEMDGMSFLNGLRPAEGERFGEIPKAFQELP